MKHPGEILQEKLDASNMSRKELAIRTNVSEKHIWTVITGENGISISFARKLGYVFETPKYWMDLQTRYDAFQLKIQEDNSISQDEIELLKPLNEILNYLIECGYIQNNCSNASKVIQLRQFLKISDLMQIPKITYNAAYRLQLTTNIKVNPYILFTWQRLCEKEAEKIAISKSFDKSLLESKINQIKAAMFKNICDGIKDIQEIFADCGIAFQVVKNFRGAPVQGFIKKASNGNLILCLTIRGKRADRFWFTLFHEIAHILNEDYNNRFVDFDSTQDKTEQMADLYAQNTLIPPDKYHSFILSTDCTSWKQIEDFANDIGVESFIVLGRLQKDEYLDWSQYSDKVVLYDWA